PELPGALELVERLTSAGVVVAAGHTTADLEATRLAFAAGVRYVTHLFNAMPGLHHRDPGPVLAALGDPRVVVGMIPDGIHVHPDLVRLVRDVVGAGRFSAVTDAMSAMGMPPGRYPMGAFTIEVDETSARQENGTLAGSVLTLDAAVRNLVTFTGARPEEALLAVTEVPAALLREESGRLALGAPADLVLLDPELNVRATVVGGDVVWDAETDR
ncbi:MAG: amidohydrolase family protein, partial [Planctomycetota bacterium]